MLPLDATPDTSAYMVAGYIVFFIIAAIYILSLVVRWRNINQDMTTLKTIEKENKLKTETTSKSKKRKTAKKK